MNYFLCPIQATKRDADLLLPLERFSLRRSLQSVLNGERESEKTNKLQPSRPGRVDLCVCELSVAEPLQYLLILIVKTRRPSTGGPCHSDETNKNSFTEKKSVAFDDSRRQLQDDKSFLRFDFKEVRHQFLMAGQSIC